MTTLEQTVAAKGGDFRYDVFISYRHVGVDERVAIRLQRLLLAYRTPRPLVRAGLPARLRRVFRDGDELSAAPSLRGELDAALRQSKAMIVICSPRLVEKPDWVRLEVERFRELGQGQIYHLLIDGTPEQTLPDWLRFNAEEPLALDIRRDGRVDLGRLKTERLKLLAAILGCQLADLVRLEGKRTRSRLLGLTALAASLSLVFAALSAGLFLSRRDLAKSNEDLKAEQATSDASLESHWRTTAAVWGTQEPERLAEMLFSDIKDPQMRLEALAAQLQIFINRDEAILKRKPNDSSLREALRAFHPKKMDIAGKLGQAKPADDSYKRIKDLRLGNAVDVLRGWKPRTDEPTTPWNNDRELQALHGQMEMQQRGRDKIEPQYNPSGPVDYAVNVSEYLPLLETWTPEGRAEARRVLDEALQFFEWKARALPLSEPDKQLRDAVSVARATIH